MSNSTGTIVWSASYTPFGMATVNEDPDGDGVAIVNNLRFQGQYYDAETGLHYNYHRTYDPNIGRYTQPDPIGLRGGYNRFGYVNANPVGFVDPYGHNPLLLYYASKFVYGAISGGVSGYISSKGTFKGTLIGVISGGAVSLALPASPSSATTFFSGILSSAAGQIATSCDHSLDPYVAFASGVGGIFGRSAATYLATPNRNLTTYLIGGLSKNQQRLQESIVGGSVAGGTESLETWSK